MIHRRLQQETSLTGQRWGCPVQLVCNFDCSASSQHAGVVAAIASMCSTYDLAIIENDRWCVVAAAFIAWCTHRVHYDFAALFSGSYLE